MTITRNSTVTSVKHPECAIGPNEPSMIRMMLTTVFQPIFSHEFHFKSIYMIDYVGLFSIALYIIKNSN